MKYLCAECEKSVPSMDPCPHCGSVRTVLASVAERHFPEQVASIRECRTAPRDPFRITGPAVISFSGGRTSGYMLHRILHAHGGTLPPDVLTVFCNTGKERPETLDFVDRVAREWNVPIVWLEYRHMGPRQPSFAVV